MRKPAELPGVVLDVEHSTLFLAGKPLPAAAIWVNCERWGGWVAGGWVAACRKRREADGEWTALVPMENGAVMLVAVEVDWRVRLSAPEGESLGLDLFLYDSSYNVERGELVSLHKRSGKLVPVGEYELSHRGCWIDCEPQWAREHMERLSRMSVVRLSRLSAVGCVPEAVPMTPVPIRNAFEGYEECECPTRVANGCG